MRIATLARTIGVLLVGFVVLGLLPTIERAFGVVTAIVVIGWFVLIFAWVWELIRCIQGLQRLSRNEGMPKPEDWFFAG
mgnify:CR=1 FL=1